MKIRYLTLGLVGSLILNIYLFDQNGDLEQKNDWLSKVDRKVDIVESQRASIQKPEANTQKIKTDIQSKLSDSKTESMNGATLYTGLPTEEELEKSQEKWHDTISEFFISGLDLRGSDVDKYFDIKNAREKELSLFLTDRIRSQGSFIYTLEDMVDENKINEKYLNELKNLMGEQGYKTYRAFRDSYNQQMIESEKMHSLIEL